MMLKIQNTRRIIKCQVYKNSPIIHKEPVQIVRKQIKTNNYSTFLTQLNEDDIQSIKLIPGSPSVEYVTNEGQKEYSNIIIDDNLINKLNDHNVQISIIKGNTPNYVINFIKNIAPLVLIYGLFDFFNNKNNSINGRSREMFGKTNYDLKISKNITTSFNEVAGIDSEKKELLEIVEFLKEPERYTNAGAKVPKGCLLCGPPGTGKTLLAKAIAGEAGVPFIACSASQFIELFVGLGASRIRGLFETARKNSPCIIFIDEIDAIAKQRGGAINAGSGNDEREQTLNQLLTEMDGFNDNSGLILIGATNRVEVIDPALLRPGRFDRKVNISFPDCKGREKILNVHSTNKNISSDVKLINIAQKTPGCSGADLMNIMNEAAILAARNNKTIITNDNIMEAYEKVTIGLPKNSIKDPKIKQIVAYHEAGHALVGLLLDNFDTIEKITILPRGSTGGVTQFLPKETDIQMYSYEYLTNKLSVALGGRAAEEIVFGTNNTTTGAAGDLESVTNIARTLIIQYGYSKILGPWNLTKISMSTQTKVDEEIETLVKNTYNNTLQLINDNRNLLDKIADLLISKETIYYDDINEILN